MVDQWVRVVGPAGQHHREATGFCSVSAMIFSPASASWRRKDRNGSLRLAVGLLGLALCGAAVVHRVLADLAAAGPFP